VSTVKVTLLESAKYVKLYGVQVVVLVVTAAVVVVVVGAAVVVVVVGATVVVVVVTP
jgi:hypothetical protein